MKKTLFLILILSVSLGLTTCKAFYGPAGEGQRQDNPGSGGTSVTVTALAPNDATLSGSLALWLDASDSAYSTACGYDVASDEGGVGCWQDKSSNAIQLIGNGSPTYVSGGLNGKPAIRFNSNSNQYFNNSIASLDLSGNAITIITVSNLGPAGASSTPIFYIGDSMKIGQYIETMSNYYGFEVPASPSNVMGVPFDFALAGNSAIFTTTADVNTNTVGIFWNGNAYSLSSYSLSSIPSMFIYIGYDSSLGSYLDGHIAEIIVYNRVLTAAERQGVEKYLSNKYNIPIAQ